MAGRVALVGKRADLALHVAGVAARVGVEVVPLDVAILGAGLHAAWDGSDLPTILVDADADADLDRAAVPEVGLAQSGGAHLGPPGDRIADLRLDQARSIIVVHLPGEEPRARALADRLGAGQVVGLPTGSAWLAERLATCPSGRVLAVVGALGGVGASTVAIACAAAAGDCLLVDAAEHSSGLDLPLGLAPGSAEGWAAIPDSGEALVAESVRAGLPEVSGITLVTGRRPAGSERRIAGVVGVGRRDFAASVIDCGRSAAVPGLATADPILLVASGTLGAVVAVRRVLEQVDSSRVLLAVRPTGWLGVGDVVAETGAVAALEVPRWRRAAERADCGGLLAGRTGRALRRFGAQVWSEVP